MRLKRRNAAPDLSAVPLLALIDELERRGVGLAAAGDDGRKLVDADPLLAELGHIAAVEFPAAVPEELSERYAKERELEAKVRWWSDRWIKSEFEARLLANVLLEDEFTSMDITTDAEEDPE